MRKVKFSVTVMLSYYYQILIVAIIISLHNILKIIFNLTFQLIFCAI